MNLSNNNDKKSKKSGIASLFGRGSVSKIGKSQFPNSMGGIMERLKGLSRKDLAMVGVGLSVLVAAPVAEYMMSKPADSANMLTSGFSSRDGQGASALASLYEPGINALSQGSADGTGEVITPLSARDPASLIMGAQPETPMMADYSAMAGMGGDSGSSGSSSSSSAPEFNDMRDSVKDSAKHGAAKAMQSAGAPTVIPRMGTVFRGGFGEIKGAGGTSINGGFKKGLTAPSKSNATPKQSKMVNPVASAGYKGASNTPNSADSSAADRLRAKADVQGGYFSGASAIKSADSANSVKMNEKIGDGAGFGGTGYGGGKGYKGPSDRGPGNSHKHSGECNTLACQAAKKRQDKALEWEFFLKYDLKKKFIEAGVNLATGIISDAVKDAASKGLKLLWGEDVEGVTRYYCLAPVNPDIKPDPCIKGNVKYTKSSTKGKTIGGDDWKNGKCPCGIYTKSEMKETYGNVGPHGDVSAQPGQNGGEGNGEGNGSDPAGEVPGDNNDIGAQYDQYVRSYDEGLQKFMGEMALVMKNKNSKKGVEAAKSAADTFVSNVEGVGFGMPYEHIYSLVANEALHDRDQAKKNIDLMHQARDKKKKAAAEKDAFIKTLEAIKEDPSKYLMKIDGMENAVSAVNKEEVGKIIDEYIADYNRGYKVNVTNPTKHLEGHAKACNVFLDRIDEANAQVKRVFLEEYKGQELARVTEIQKNLNDQSKNSKALVKEFLDGMTGEFSKDIAQAEAVPGDVRESPQDAKHYPQQYVRVWRGLSADFGTDSGANEGALKQLYEAEAKKIKANEWDAWKYNDSPLNVLESYLPRETTAETKMTKTDFYAPGFRIVVEIPLALAEQNTALTNMHGNMDEFLAMKAAIEAELKEKHHINTKPEGEAHNPPSTPETPDPVVNPNTPTVNNVPNAKCIGEGNCTYQQVKDQEAWAKKHGRYGKENQSPIWNNDMLYHDLPNGWKADASAGSDYNTNAMKTHVLRSEYDEIDSKLRLAKANGDQEAVAKYSAELESKKNELKDSVNRTNYAWAQICENHKKTQADKKACYNGVSAPEPETTTTRSARSVPPITNGQNNGSRTVPEETEKRFCVVKIDNNDSCRKGNVMFNKQSNKAEEINGWNDCTCGKWTRSEMKELYGNTESEVSSLQDKFKHDWRNFNIPGVGTWDLVLSLHDSTEDRVIYRAKRSMVSRAEGGRRMTPPVRVLCKKEGNKYIISDVQLNLPFDQASNNKIEDIQYRECSDILK